MIEKISYNLANVLKNEKVITQEEFEVYDYGIQITLANLVNCIIVVLVGITFHAEVEAVIFYCSFVSLRYFCGGYHANSYRKCFLLFLLTCMSCITFSKYIASYGVEIVKTGSFLVADIWLGINIFRKAPIADGNRQASIEEKAMCRRKSIYLYIFWSGVGIILWRLGQVRMQSCLISTFIAVSILMIQGKGGSKRNEKERT